MASLLSALFSSRSKLILTLTSFILPMLSPLPLELFDFFAARMALFLDCASAVPMTLDRLAIGNSCVGYTDTTG